MKLAIRACNSSIFSVYFPGSKSVILMKIHPAPSEVSEVKWAALRCSPNEFYSQWFAMNLENLLAPNIQGKMATNEKKKSAQAKNLV